MYKVLLPICTLTWRVNNYVSRQEKVQTGEMEVQENQTVVIILSTDDKTQYC